MNAIAEPVALVTGAGRGIGRATALRFAQAGYLVIATDQNIEAAQSTARAIVDAGGKAWGEMLDVSAQPAWDVLSDRIKRELGRLDALVNNAGIFRFRPLSESPQSDWKLMRRVNIEGSLLGMRTAMQVMADTRRAGSIVNLSSLGGLVASVDTAFYGTTKGAVTAMTRSAAAEGATFDKSIRINSVHPGVIWTDMLFEQIGGQDALRESFAETTPLRTVGRAEDIAEAIFFLGSDASGMLTGTSLVVDGARGAE